MPDALTWTVTINAPVEKVWPLVADVGKHADWSPRPYRMEWLEGEPNAVGSTFRSHGWLPNDKDHKMEGRVTTNEPMTRFGLTSSDDGTAATEWGNRYDVTANGATTTVVRTMVAPPLKGFGKIAFAIATPLLVRPGVQRGLDMLKAKAEAGS
jgi:uncharacterized protein YndB with AHSA1/START domain